MTPDQWLRVRELFEQAFERDPAVVAEWLAYQPADPAIRAEVVSLLAHYTQAASFLAEPLSGRVPDLFFETDALEPGKVIGPYTIVREIGRGGMGHVYLAQDARLGRTVALKALPPRLTADPARRERLRREARAAAALTHTGICTIYALEEIDDALFIAAEYVDGWTLRDEIASGHRPSTADVLATARDLAAALASAHAKGIVHRDLKPENIMRARDGRMKILDFGLAQIDEAVEDPVPMRVTQPGMLLGTPAYMAPEQLNSQPADARSDVFAFGVLLYEYASGVHPFEAATPLAMAARVLESDPRPIENICPTLPRPLETVIARCLRKEADERFASAVDLAMALAREPDNRVQPRPITTWWRAHQLIVMLLYIAASAVAWQIKEWIHGPFDLVFLAIGIAAAVGGVFRGHLVFTEWMNPEAMQRERARARPITLMVDLGIAALLAADAIAVARGRPLMAVLTMMLVVLIALARTVLEPATTGAAFSNMD